MYASAKFRFRRDASTVEMKDVLLQEIEGVPEPLLVEVVDFLRFLKVQRAQEHLDLFALHGNLRGH